MPGPVSIAAQLTLPDGRQLVTSLTMHPADDRAAGAAACAGLQLVLDDLTFAARHADVPCPVEPSASPLPVPPQHAAPDDRPTAVLPLDRRDVLRGDRYPPPPVG